MWSRNPDAELFEAEARVILGARALMVRSMAGAKPGEAPFTPAVAQALWSGEAAVFIKDGKPLPPTRERWLETREGMLVFTLPQEPEERRGDEGPACVVVTLGR